MKATIEKEWANIDVQDAAIEDSAGQIATAEADLKPQPQRFLRRRHLPSVRRRRISLRPLTLLSVPLASLRRR